MFPFLKSLFNFKGQMARKQYALVNLGLLVFLLFLAKLQAFGIILPNAVGVPLLIIMAVIRLFSDVQRLRDLHQPIIAILFVVALILFLPEFTIQVILIWTISLALIKNSDAISKKLPPALSKENGKEDKV